MSDWLTTQYSKMLFERIGLRPGPNVAGIAEDDGQIVVWFTNGTEMRYNQKGEPVDGGVIH